VFNNHAISPSGIIVARCLKDQYYHQERAVLMIIDESCREITGGNHSYYENCSTKDNFNLTDLKRGMVQGLMVHVHGVTFITQGGG
jgi:hypothetical protein